MSEFIGRNIDFALAVEEVRGTAETVASKNVRKVSCNIQPLVEKVTDDTTFGKLEDAERSRIVRKWSEGDVDGIVHADVLGYYLYNIYGDVETATEGGAYRHTFNLEQSIKHPTLTAFVKDADVRQVKIANTMLTSMSLDATTDDYVRYSASFIGNEQADDSSTIPALDTEYDFISRDIEVKIAETSGGLSGANALNLKEFSIEFNTNAEADFVFGNYSPNDIYNRQFEITGSFNLNFTDETFQDLYNSDDFRFMEIKIVSEATIGSTAKPEITILLDKVQITEWERSSDADDLSTQSVSFKAFYNTTTEKASQVELVNLVDAYEITSS